MAQRNRTHPNQFYLSDEEQYILDEKFRLSGMRSKSAFLRKLILYGFVYEVDYSHIRKMNGLLGNIGSNLNQIAKRINTTEQLPRNDTNRENKAFHLIQAFEPGEISYEEAHTIGKELADRLLGGRYSYVLTTHIDKGHVHNHIIFCAADNLDYKHYHDCKKSYWNIRSLSDQLCREHGLSVIEPSEKRGVTYKEWTSNKDDKSWKAQLRKDINQFIKFSSSYEEFLALMTASIRKTNRSMTAMKKQKTGTGPAAKSHSDGDQGAGTD